MIGGTWYNTFICKKLYENSFEGVIRNEGTDRYNSMCLIDSHEE